MNGFSRLAFVETKLFLREKAATLAVFGLPVALVIGFGLIPGFGQPQKSLSDQIGTEYIASLGVAIVLATLGLNGVPMVIGQYRERGILRRLGVTPVRPLTLLVAKLTVWAASAIVSVAFVIAVVRIAFHVPTPAAPGWFVLSVLLGIGSVFALGMAQAGGFHRPAVSTVAIWVLLACVDVVLVGAFTALGVKSEEQNQARKGMIIELAEANQRLEEIMAENTGLQAQLLTQAREAGAGDERQRMAREIHDTLAQGLTGIITQLEAAQQTASDAERERRIGNAKRLARDSLAEARRSVQALRPRALENSRLPDALADEVARWSATSGVAGEVETTGAARPLHPEVEVTLLRVAQEALANVAKHAGASRAGVTLSYMEDVVSLDVRDDGAGFIPPTAAPTSNGIKVNGSKVNGSKVNGSKVNGSKVNGGPSDGGFGLIAMRQRVSRLAGQLEIESEPGAGTAVSASLPAIPLGEST